MNVSLATFILRRQNPFYPTDRASCLLFYHWSQLYYFGMLSIRGVEHGDVILRVPNLAVREPLFTYELKTQSRIREFIDGEAHIKGFLLAYLGLTNYYQISPEWESNKGYADFFFKPSPSLPDIEYVYLLEVYLGGRGDGGSVIVTESRPVVY